MRGEPFYEYFKSKMTSLIIVLIVVVVFFAFSGSRVVFYTSSTHESSSRCASIASASAVVKHLEMVAPMDDLKAAGMLRQKDSFHAKRPGDGDRGHCRTLQ